MNDKTEMNHIPKVSVIIPVYNEEKYLRQCMDNIISQTLRDIEIICIDDGSTDDSFRILQEYEKKDSRVLVIREENKGAGAARNTGIQKAGGRYLYFPDADDYCEPSLLEIAYKKAEDTEADVTVFRSRQIDVETGKSSPCRYSVYIDKLPAKCPFQISDVQGNFFRFIMGWAWDKLFRKSFIETNNILFQEQRTTNDMYFTYTALMKAQRITTLDTELYNHRINITASLSMTRNDSFRCFYDALIKVQDEIKKMGLEDKYRQVFVDYALHCCLANLNVLDGDSARELHGLLNSEYFRELGIYDAPSEWFTSSNEYSEYLIIIDEKEGYDGYEKYHLRQMLISSKKENELLKKEITDIREENKKLEGIQAERDHYKYCLDEVWKSKSLKIGRAITWIPRKISGKEQNS